MKHEADSVAILDHLYGEIGPEEEGRLLAHADGCAECKEEIAAARRVLTAYRCAPAPRPPADAAAKALRRVREAKAAAVPAVVPVPAIAPPPAPAIAPAPASPPEKTAPLAVGAKSESPDVVTVVGEIVSVPVPAARVFSRPVAWWRQPWIGAAAGVLFICSLLVIIPPSPDEVEKALQDSFANEADTAAPAGRMPVEVDRPELAVAALADREDSAAFAGRASVSARAEPPDPITVAPAPARDAPSSAPTAFAGGMPAERGRSALSGAAPAAGEGRAAGDGRAVGKADPALAPSRAAAEGEPPSLPRAEMAERKGAASGEGEMAAKKASALKKQKSESAAASAAPAAPAVAAPTVAAPAAAAPAESAEKAEDAIRHLLDEAFARLRAGEAARAHLLLSELVYRFPYGDHVPAALQAKARCEAKLGREAEAKATGEELRALDAKAADSLLRELGGGAKAADLLPMAPPASGTPRSRVVIEPRRRALTTDDYERE